MIGRLAPQLHQELVAMLESERDRLLRTVRSLTEAQRLMSESQGEESDAGGEQADVASDLAEQELDMALEHAERERLAEIEAALDRLAEGRYGACEGCGVPIDMARLRAMPWVRYCLRCAKQAAIASPSRD